LPAVKKADTQSNGVFMANTKRSALPVLPVALFLVTALLASCRSGPSAARNDGIVGTITATPFGISTQTETPLQSEPSFFNARLQMFQVIRPLDDKATVLFFTNQREADAHVREIAGKERRPGVPFFDSWPPKRRTGGDYDMLARRNLSDAINEELNTIMNRNLRDSDWGDTGHPVFVHELTGRTTDHFVIIREGYVGRINRLEARSANLHFYSVRQE
jgi:hypothetical protein